MSQRMRRGIIMQMRMLRRKAEKTMTKRAGWLKNAFFWAAAAAQVVFLCLVSLRAGGAVVEEDAGKAYTHMMAMWDSGTLLVPDWKYITTMELDCTTLLALPVYGLTGNPILAYWLGLLRRGGVPGAAAL